MEISEAPICDQWPLAHRLEVVVMRDEDLAVLDAMSGDDRIFRVFDQNILQAGRRESLACQVVCNLLSDIVVEEEGGRRQSYAALARFFS